MAPNNSRFKEQNSITVNKKKIHYRVQIKTSYIYKERFFFVTHLWVLLLNEYLDTSGSGVATIYYQWKKMINWSITGNLTTGSGIMIGRCFLDSQHRECFRHPANVGRTFLRYTNDELTNNLRGAFNKFPDSFCRRLLRIQYLIAIHLMRRLTNFYDFTFKWTATAAIGIHPTKAWLSQLVNFKNAISTSGHFRRTICNKILF